MNAPQSTAHAERVAADRLDLSHEIRDRIADTLAEHAAARVVAEVGVLMTDEARTAYVDTLVPQLYELLSAVALPPIRSWQIGGRAEVA